MAAEGSGREGNGAPAPPPTGSAPAPRHWQGASAPSACGPIRARHEVANRKAPGQRPRGPPPAPSLLRADGAPAGPGGHIGVGQGLPRPLPGFRRPVPPGGPAALRDASGRRGPSRSSRGLRVCPRGTPPASSLLRGPEPAFPRRPRRGFAQGAPVPPGAAAEVPRGAGAAADGGEEAAGRGPPAPAAGAAGGRGRRAPGRLPLHQGGGELQPAGGARPALPPAGRAAVRPPGVPGRGAPDLPGAAGPRRAVQPRGVRALSAGLVQVLLSAGSQSRPRTRGDVWTLDLAEGSATALWGHGGLPVLLDDGLAVPPDVLLHADAAQRAGAAPGAAGPGGLAAAALGTLHPALGARHPGLPGRAEPAPGPRAAAAALHPAAVRGQGPAPRRARRPALPRTDGGCGLLVLALPRVAGRHRALVQHRPEQELQLGHLPAAVVLLLGSAAGPGQQPAVRAAGPRGQEGLGAAPAGPGLRGPVLAAPPQGAALHHLHLPPAERRGCPGLRPPAEQRQEVLAAPSRLPPGAGAPGAECRPLGHGPVRVPLQLPRRRGHAAAARPGAAPDRRRPAHRRGCCPDGRVPVLGGQRRLEIREEGGCAARVGAHAGLHAPAHGGGPGAPGPLPGHTPGAGQRRGHHGGQSEPDHAASLQRQPADKAGASGETARALLRERPAPDKNSTGTATRTPCLLHGPEGWPKPPAARGGPHVGLHTERWPSCWLPWKPLWGLAPNKCSRGKVACLWL